MNRIVSLLLGFALALPCAAVADTPTLAPEETAIFPDVPPGHWAAEAVKRLAGHGLIEGRGTGKFDGEAPVTRYECAAVLARLTNRLVCDVQSISEITNAEPQPSIASTLRRRVWIAPSKRPGFTDIATTHWALPAVDHVAKQGFMEGVQRGRFSGNAPLKRYEFSLVAGRLLSPVEYVDSP